MFVFGSEIGGDSSAATAVALLKSDKDNRMPIVEVGLVMRKARLWMCQLGNYACIY